MNKHNDNNREYIKYHAPNNIIASFALVVLLGACANVPLKEGGDVNNVQ